MIILRQIQVSFGNNIKTALDACKKYDFKLFKENFKKNNNTFPYIKPEQAKIGVIKNNGNTIALIAYAYPEDLKDYRKAHKDSHINSGHIFDFEVLEDYRGNNLGNILMEGVINEMKQNHIEEVTLMAIDKNMAKYYELRYGFKTYSDGDKDNSPMLYKNVL